MVLASMLPGRYDNWNQNYFEVRRKLPEEQRHERLHTRIAPIATGTTGATGAAGSHAFFAEDYRDNEPQKVVRRRVLLLTADDAASAVRMATYWLRDGDAAPGADNSPSPLPLENYLYYPGCDVFWTRDAGQFAAATRGAACRWQSPALGEVRGDYRYQLSPTEWRQYEEQRDRRGRLLAGHPSGNAYELQRAREFSCYADVPGVGGGAAIAFERYQPLQLHDKGGAVWFTTRDPAARNLGLTLTSVTWPINNEAGAFTRNSLVLYVNERVDGQVKNIAYAATQPDAERLLINLKFMLVNCFRQSNRQIEPQF